MRRLIYILALAALVCLGIGGCTPRRVGEAMNRADSLMTSAPDSALALLDAIDPATLRTDAARARHAVLLTRARHLAYVPVYDDSLIAIGTDYYATHGTHAEKAEAFYMSSVVNNYHQRYEQSIVDGLRAEKHALATSDHLLLGLVYRTIADGFDRLYDWSSALHYYTLSYDNFKIAPENIYTDWARFDLARGYSILEDYDQAFKLLDTIHATVLSANNTALLSTSLTLKAKCGFDNQNYEVAINSINLKRLLAKETLCPTDYRMWGVAYVYVGKLDSAKIFRDSLRNVDPQDFSIDYEINKAEGNYKQANSQLEVLVESDNSQLSNVLKRNYAATISSFYDKEAAKDLELLKRERINKYLLVILGIMSVIIGILFYKRRTQQLRQKIDETILVASTLKSMLQMKESSIDSLRNSLANLQADSRLMESTVSDLKDKLAEKELAMEAVRSKTRAALATRFDTIERLCESYQFYFDRPDKQAKIYAQVASLIEGIKSDKTIIAGFEKIVNKHLDNLMKRFRTDFPKLHSWEYSMFLLFTLGFSANAIAIIQGVKIDIIYSRKAALKRKIKESHAESNLEYTEVLSLISNNQYIIAKICCIVL